MDDLQFKLAFPAVSKGELFFKDGKRLDIFHCFATKLGFHKICNTSMINVDSRAMTHCDICTELN